MAGDQILKLTMYADDTAVVCRTQGELDALIEIMILYGKASGARVNWNKTFLLLLEILRLMTVPEARIVCPKNPYFHLRVSVETDTIKQIQDFWETTLTKFRRIAGQWNKCHLFMKNRIMIATSLMYSISRYVINFINIPFDIKKTLEKKYYKLI